MLLIDLNKKKVKLLTHYPPGDFQDYQSFDFVTCNIHNKKKDTRDYFGYTTYGYCNKIPDLKVDIASRAYSTPSPHRWVSATLS